MPQLRRSGEDPATSSTTPALRVLLGSGDAQALDAQTFSFRNHRYRGTFSRLADGQILSLVSLEEYLYSVVGREMPQSWPAAALQAQAICARTYVLQRSDPRRAYDVMPSEADQVYQGIDAEAPATTNAVVATGGQVLRFAEAFARVAYSSCCGGHTESANVVWGGNAVPYLQGVPCTWCAASPNFAWTQDVDASAVARAVPPNAPPVGDVRALRVAASDASGRAIALSVEGSIGTATVDGPAFRSAVGTRIIRSLLIQRIDADGDAGFAIYGAGLGHGVGLCQWGAKGLALANRTAVDILAYYFPGTEIGDE